MGEAVGHAVCRIAAGVDREGALQFVVAGSVQEIADGDHARHSSSEEHQLASGSALAERLCLGVEFSASLAQVTVRNAKVHRLQRGVAGEKHLVGGVPKIVFGCDLGEILSTGGNRD